MKIETGVKSADFNSLVQISSATATTTLSFWGTRRIKAVGYDNRAPIDSLAGRVMELVRSKKFEYTQEERDMGIQIVANINKLYSDSDQQVANSNFLTRFFCALESFYYQISHPCTYPESITKSAIRWTWDTSKQYYYRPGFNEVFEYYTKKQYTEKFHREGDFWVSRSWSNGIALDLGWDIVQAASDRMQRRL